MRTLVTGAGGYVGQRLVASLLRAGHEVVATARRPERLGAYDFAGRARLERLDADDAASCHHAVAGVQVAYYLVHGIGGADYARTDRARAQTFAVAARAAGVGRVVYLGGLVPRGEKLSEHLASRAEVGEVLGEHGPELVWLRAAVVLGAGSASYEITRYLGDWLPLIPLPPWMDTLVQPVAADDVLRALVAAAAHLPPGSYDLGGPERVPYAELVRRYLRVAGLHRVLAPTPPVPTRVASWVVARLTPLPQDMVADLVLSLANTMVADTGPISAHLPGGATSVDDALRRSRVGSHVRRSRLPGVCAAPDPLQLCATDADWAHRAR
ncbi:MAG: NAD(P)H-binding protein [Mycobacteriaceae bacterium]